MHREDDKTPFLSVIIPAYNEETRIGPTLDKIKAYFDGQDYESEVIVVDDGSSDGTVSVVQMRQSSWPQLTLLQNGRNIGKGYSVRNGFANGRGEILLFSDADLSTPIEETFKLLNAIDSGAAVAIGSRGLEKSEVRAHQPWYREIMGKMFNRLVRCIAVSKIKDTQCGFKAFTRKASEMIRPRLHLNGFSFDVEVLFVAGRLGLPIQEIPVVWEHKVYSRVRVVGDSVKMFQDLVRIRYLHRWSRYR